MITHLLQTPRRGVSTDNTMKILFCLFLCFCVLGCTNESSDPSNDADLEDMAYEEDDAELYLDEVTGTASVTVGTHQADLDMDDCYGTIGRDINENLYSIILNLSGYDAEAGPDADENASIHIEGSNPDGIFGATFTYRPAIEGHEGWNTLLGRDEMASMKLHIDDILFAPVAGESLGMNGNEERTINLEMSDFMISKSGDASAGPVEASFTYVGECSINVGEE